MTASVRRLGGPADQAFQIVFVVAELEVDLSSRRPIMIPEKPWYSRKLSMTSNPRPSQ